MGILGITNRSEDWMLAKHFAPYLTNQVDRGKPRARRVRLVEKLSRHLNGHPTNGLQDADIELHWFPVRDHLVRESGGKTSGRVYRAMVNRIRPQIHDKYEELFGKEGENLRERVCTYWGEEIRENKDAYSPQYVRDLREDKLFSNVRRTEIDVVLETSSHLFIGEVKWESRLDKDKENVLVHQLIRQYVTARIAVDILGLEKPKTVVPFIVCDKGKRRESILNTDQVRFMIDEMKVLKPNNILTWEQIDDIAKG